MSSHTNMDNKNNPTSTVPEFEFTLPMTEIDEPGQVGDIGNITIPIEIVEVTQDSMTFRKRSHVELSQLRKGTMKEMEDHLNEKYPPKED